MKFAYTAWNNETSPLPICRRGPITTNPTMTPNRPSPEPDLSSVPFYEGLQQHCLLVQRCPHCGTIQLGELYCNHCHADGLQWVPASGRARLHSYVHMHMSYHEGFADQIPYNAATIELEEGPRFYTNIVGMDDQALVIGMPLQVQYSTLSTGTVVPVFAPRTEQ